MLKATFFNSDYVIESILLQISILHYCQFRMGEPQPGTSKSKTMYSEEEKKLLLDIVRHGSNGKFFSVITNKAGNLNQLKNR